MIFTSARRWCNDIECLCTARQRCHFVGKLVISSAQLVLQHLCCNYCFVSTVSFSMGAAGSSFDAVEVKNKIEQTDSGLKTVNKWADGGSLNRRGDVGAVKVIIKP